MQLQFGASCSWPSFLLGHFSAVLLTLQCFGFSVAISAILYQISHFQIAKSKSLVILKNDLAANILSFGVIIYLILSNATNNNALNLIQ